MKHKRITVTGGKGFLGTHVIKALKEIRGHDPKAPEFDIVSPRISIADLPDYDLTKGDDVRRMYDEQTPDIVIHLAAKVGGIGFNRENPATLYYDNIMMGTQLIHEGWRRGIDKFVALGTICAYPKHTPIPFREENLWDGYPEETNAPYGLAKKMMLVQSQAYRAQYGFNSIFLLPVNLYGPGDNFDPRASHVIPALIKKCVDARREGQDEIVIWGTGSVTREFFYVEDAAEAIVLAMERYNESEPLNLGAGFEIVELTGFKGRLIWDASQPEGQPRRMLDISKAREKFGFTAQTDFRYGLAKTIEWYEKHG
jgi:GDP-L-fucose synthase